MKQFLKTGISIAFLMATTQVMWGEEQATSEMNLYATKLQSTSIVDRETRQVDLYFGINTDTKGVWIYLDQNNDKNYTDGELIYGNANKEGTREDTYITIKNCTIPTDWPGGTYGWAVKVKSNATVASTEPCIARTYNNVTNRYKFQYPKALAIDTYTESEYCGYSYVGEAGELSITTKPSDSRVYRAGSSQGVYVFGPSLGVYWSSQNQEELKQKPYGAFNGNVDWKLAAQYGYYGPYRISTDKDGYVYLCQNYKTYTDKNNAAATEIHERVWRVHASQLINDNRNKDTQFTCILTTDMLNAQEVTFNNKTTRLPKRVISMSIGQEGEKKILYVISGYTTDQMFNDDQVFLSSWEITETGNGNCDLTHKRSLYLKNIPYTTSNNNSLPQSLKSQDCSVVPGNNNGDIWLFQRTESGTDRSFFSALHLSPSGNNTWAANYRISSVADDGYGVSNTCGVGAISKHPTKEGTGYYLAMPTQYISDHNKHIVAIWKINDNNGINISRNLTYTIYNPKNIETGFETNDDVSDQYATPLDAVAFDIANNLYVTSSKQRRLFVYALPKESHHTTPASNAAALSVPYKVTWNSTETGYTIQDGVYNTTKNSLYPYLYNTDKLPSLNKEGYVFEGWYDNEQTEGTPLQYIDQDITLYAKWTEIKINEGTNVDNEPIIDLVKDQTVRMKVSRKLQGDMFSTLCLPFAVDYEILNSATWDDGSEGKPLKDATLWTFNSVTTDEGTNTKTLVFTNTNEKIPAYTPFLILPKNDVAKDIFFHYVEISMPDNLEETGTVTNNDITFHGAINPVELPSNAFFLVADNRLAVSNQEGATLPALRGYFTAPSGSKLQIRTQQGTTTLLDNINSEMKNAYKILQDGNIYIIRDNRVYDLKGQVVSDRL